MSSQVECPSCGRADPEIIVSNVTGRDGFQYALKCRSCDMQSEWCGSEWTALEEWALPRSDRTGGDGLLQDVIHALGLAHSLLLNSPSRDKVWMALLRLERSGLEHATMCLACCETLFDGDRGCDLAECPHKAAPPQPAPDAMREALRQAFISGAMAVHQEWHACHDRGEGPPRGDPEFFEAANDYALSAPVPSGEAPMTQEMADDISRRST